MTGEGWEKKKSATSEKKKKIELTTYDLKPNDTNSRQIMSLQYIIYIKSN